MSRERRPYHFWSSRQVFDVELRTFKIQMRSSLFIEKADIHTNSLLLIRFDNEYAIFTSNTPNTLPLLFAFKFFNHYTKYKLRNTMPDQHGHKGSKNVFSMDAVPYNPP